MKDVKPQGRKSIVDYVYGQLRTHATQLSEVQSRELASSLTRQVISEVAAQIAAEVALQTTEIAAANASPAEAEPS
jgi:hypothetical protein